MNAAKDLIQSGDEKLGSVPLGDSTLNLFGIWTILVNVYHYQTHELPLLLPILGHAPAFDCSDRIRRLW